MAAIVAPAGSASIRWYGSRVTRALCGTLRTARTTATSSSSRPDSPRLHSSAAASGARRAVLASVVCSLAVSRGAPVMAGSTTRSDYEKVLDEPNFPLEWPFQPENFQRYDEAPDTQFYDAPRFVTHIDDGAIRALTAFYQETFPPSGSKDVAILDMCSSWVSHYPKDYTAGKISGLGMNEEELARNSALTDYAVKDLNSDPTLPYDDNTFDIITNAVSVDYLTKPKEVFAEMHRVLKPGGTAMMSFSNRCFPTKAISIWTATGDMDHIYIVGSYFHYTPGFGPPSCRDISPKAGLFSAAGDPMYVVYASKSAEAVDM
mmetsp:Transcript_28279/g.79831  ORF Transcript_28279/g.79831 Transcript_28279/m.79831 type:complete len:318 (-) Transcript_28279:217-1170(-)|eukprot:CAMPEP_0117666356 /NCGR_PEP_ID=MMETSP0804-20121206/10332_1 /TAXON_ID=1074897 /ORGANISM="Tetraselmis astigmatica, Strain CCMP880" /LENGTH=317 /DNA_ID=CAMNT_0005473895 /DNA_START=212 /DNA_END=1165 /DNA_ORIENTATION=-